MNANSIHTRIYNLGENVLSFINEHTTSFSEGDILVVTSKILALAESNVAPKNTFADLLKNISDACINTPWATLTLHKDEWRINAGIDESNTKDVLILLPKDSFASAKTIALHIKKKFGLKRFGVIITDTRSTPLRIGTIGKAIGFYGFKPLKSYIGKKDLYGRKSRVTQSNLVDALAGTAVLLMGEGNEQTPLVHIQNAPVSFVSRDVYPIEKILSIHPQKDIFSYLFTSPTVRQKTPKHPPQHHT